MKLKIISWNIWVDCNFEKVAEFLKASNADIIGLQEVRTDDKSRDFIKFLSGLGYDNVYAPVQEWKEPKFNFGPTLFSKHPIKLKETHILSQNDCRATVQADVDINGTILHVFSTHLIHTHQKPSDIQVLQGNSLLKVLPTENTIVMGDFNATTESQVIKNMKEVLVDADPSSQPTWCLYENGCDVCKIKDISIRLDYIFISKDLKTNSFKVEDSKASDHLPISIIINI